MDAHNWDAQTSDSKDWQELLAGYVLGDLSSKEMEQVQMHLVNNLEAQLEVEELRATLNLLPLSLPEANPPETVREQLRQSAQQLGPSQFEQSPSVTDADLDARRQAPQPQQQSRRQFRSFRRRRNWGLGVGSIAAASIITLLGLQNYQLQQQLAEVQSQHEIALRAIEAQLSETVLERDRYQEMISMLRLPNNRLLPISGAGYLEVSSGSLVIAPQKSWSVLTLQNLPAPPEGKAYQLWATVNGQKIYCVEFKPDAEGKVLVEVPVSGWGSAPMVAITLEDEGTIPDEASEMIMNSPFI